MHNGLEPVTDDTDAFGRTVTPTDTALTLLPLAWQVEVMTSPAAKAGLIGDKVQVPPLTVVVPIETPFLYTVIVDPSASVLVPLTEVAPSHIGEFTVGVADTFLELEAKLRHCGDEIALAVIL